MKRLCNPITAIVGMVFLWLTLLLLFISLAPRFVNLRIGYIDQAVFANFDGIHYLDIAEWGYFNYGEAFFPLYPLLIRFFLKIFPIPPYFIGMCISLSSFTAGLVLLYKMVKKYYPSAAIWTILFIITSPTAFFFSCVYTEGLFFFFCVSFFYALREKKWLWAGIIGALASATRSIGVLFLIPYIIEYIQTEPGKRVKQYIAPLFLIPLGLFIYMYFLWGRTGDPIFFIHAQPAFGANRSGSEIILLPQVIYRYLRMMFTTFTIPTPLSYIVMVSEFIITSVSFLLLYIGWKKRLAPSFLWYSLFVLVVPTLSGTLSSMPRYILCAFPLFLILGMIQNKTIKVGLLVFFGILQSLAWMLFVQGWFIS